MPVNRNEIRQRFAAEAVQRAMEALGTTGRELAAAAGLTPEYLSRFLKGLPISDTRLRGVCRGLMLLAVCRGWTADEAWRFNDYDLIGLGRSLDRERVLAEVYRRADARQLLDAAPAEYPREEVPA